MVSNTYDDMGKKHGKYDMDRVGLFSEMPYMIDDKFINRNKSNDVRDLKKSQMYPGILKTKTGLQDAYFDRKFKRLFESEKWQPRSSIIDTNVSGNSKNQKYIQPFIPTGNTKRHSTPGDNFGTFGPKLPAMSVVQRPLPKKEKILPNITTMPTNTRGPGYIDIGLSSFPEYKSDPYDDDSRNLKNVKKNKKSVAPFILCGPGEFFEKNPYFCEVIKPTYRKPFKQTFKTKPFIPTSTSKRIGRGFDSWPIHLTDRYIDPNRIEYNYQKNKNENHIKTFYPQTRNKSFYTTSTMQRKLKSAMNNLNWKTFEPIHIPRKIQKYIIH